MATRHIVIAGRVQGVGFREALCREARRRGLSGWVRNRQDGTVEAVLQGPLEAVDEALAWAREGPAPAHVTRLTVLSEAEVILPERGFLRMPTA